MDNYDIILPKPRKPVRPVPPLPSFQPKNQVIIINDNGGQGGSTDPSVISALQIISVKVANLENIVNDISLSSLELGEVSGTAYPGDLGKRNADAISLISDALENDFVSKDYFTVAITEALVPYATTDALVQNVESLRNDLEISISAVEEKVPELVSAAIDNLDLYPSATYYPILSGIEDLNNEIDSF